MAEMSYMMIDGVLGDVLMHGYGVIVIFTMMDACMIGIADGIGRAH